MARAKKVKRSLSAGLARSADKRHLTGEARERYIIGGAINAEKRHEARLKRGKAARAAPKKTASTSSTERLELVVRKNADASEKRGHDVYSLYKPNAKTPFTSATYRKRSVALHEAKVEMEKVNHPKGVHKQSNLI